MRSESKSDIRMTNMSRISNQTNMKDIRVTQMSKISNNTNISSKKKESVGYADHNSSSL